MSASMQRELAGETRCSHTIAKARLPCVSCALNTCALEELVLYTRAYKWASTSLYEVEMALKQLKNKIVSGEDAIKVELIRAGGKPQITSAYTGFFRDGRKRIDVVLVVQDDGDQEVEKIRINFLVNAIKTGLQLELEPGLKAGANKHAGHRKVDGYRRSWTPAIPEESLVTIFRDLS
ncbi:hypothetical protein EVAR_5942_1 [Eumeta japonica]|uniref:Anoctamin dimerisation domain-containing protein n=1 Tax=Eumeta variegata TaxID=151549 RepID=A0A4C1TFP4_EUMVA|nr:hypothetical protein EVAR_5942_1 [Eumeta japonica]